MNDLLLNPLVMAFLGIASAITMFSKKQPENGGARLILAVWFTWVFLHPEIPADFQRVMGRFVVAGVLFIDIISFIAFSYYKKKYEKAISSAMETDVQ